MRARRGQITIINSFLRFRYCVTLAFLGMLGTVFFRLQSPVNRYDYFWDAPLAFSIVGALLLLGFFLFMLDTAAVFLPASLRYFLRLCAVYLISVRAIKFLTLAVLLPRAGLDEFANKCYVTSLQVTLAIYILPLGFFLFFNRKLFLPVLKFFLNVAFLMLLMSLIQFLFYHRYHNNVNSPYRPIGSSPAALESKPNVYIFIFDYWDYDYIFKNKSLLQSMKRLQLLQRDFDFYHNAWSPAGNTEQSIPTLLFAADPNFLNSKKELRKMLFDSDFGKYESIFYEPKRLGYATVLVGYWLNYGDLLRDRVDYLKVFNFTAPQNFWPRVAFHLRFLIKHMPPTVLRRVPGWSLLENDLKWEVERAIRFDEECMLTVETIIREEMNPSFAVFHIFAPHPPFVFDRHGSKHDIEHVNSIANYKNALLHVDTTIGKVITILKESKKYDNSIVIFTSDHGAAIDRLQKGAVAELDVLSRRSQHVPFLIKVPQQRQGRDYHKHFETKNMHRLIEELIRQFAS